jgi:hypothetical protein
MMAFHDDFAGGAMKVVIERSGGFAGMKRRGEREGEALTQEQHTALRELLRPDRPTPSSKPGGDRFVFKVTVDEEHGSRSVTVPESHMPSVLAKIVN